jgi:hypothetical protein
MEDTKPLSAELASELSALLAAGQTITALKRCREILSCSLREASARIESLRVVTSQSVFGPPCPNCGEPLRTFVAQQCFKCGADWHISTKVCCKK